MTNLFCPQCGTKIDPATPGGICAACLLKPGMEKVIDPGSVTTSAGTTPFPHRFTPPPISELAPHFPELEILQLLGQGGMGAVYQARQLRLDRLVALKILPQSAGQEEEFANRFTREARAMARLNHPSIVNIHDYGDKAGWFYFIMEYVDGVNLRQAILAKSVEPKEALSIVGQICDAMQYAHQEGVVHRDIKPENILLDKRGRAKIADFGLAKLLGQSTLSSHLTGTHQVMGTLGYMAPEQMEGARQVDHRADLYAVGVVFYELLTGELPLGRFAPPSHKVKIDVRLDEVVLKTLEKEPDRRYQHASQIKHDVEHISRTEEITLTLKPRKEQASNESGRFPQLNAAAITLIVLGLLELMLLGVGMLQLIEKQHLRLQQETPWLIITMLDLGAGVVVVLAGILMLQRRLWPLALIGAIVAVIPLAPLADMSQSSYKNSERELIRQASKLGINFKNPEQDLSLLSSEARSLREKIGQVWNQALEDNNTLIFFRWPTILVTWLSIPAGLWALLLLVRSEVKALFVQRAAILVRSETSEVAVERTSPSMGPELGHALLGLLAVVCLGLGCSFIVWIGSSLMSGESMRVPASGERLSEVGAIVLAILGIVLILAGIFFLMQTLRFAREQKWSLTVRIQFGFLAGLFSLGGLLIFILVIKSLVAGQALFSTFSFTIINGAEAAGWVVGLLTGGVVACSISFAPLNARTVKRLVISVGVAVLAIIVFLLVFARTTMIPVRMTIQ